MVIRRIATSPGIEAGPTPENFRRIVDSIPHMLWTAAADGTIDYVNAHATSYTGISLQEIRSGGWQAMYHPEDVDACVERWSRALASGEPFEAEYRIRRIDGEYRWHSHSVMPMRDRLGRIQFWYGTCTDIDRRKKTEQRLEQARRTLESLVAARTQALEQTAEHLRAFLDSVPAIAWIKDSRLRYVWVSANYERQLGKSLHEIRGKENSAVWPEEVARKHRRVDERVLRTMRPVQSVHRNIYADGRVGQLLVVKFPLSDKGGAPGVAAIAFEVGGDEQHDDFDSDPLESLSGRELQVLRMIVDGYTSAEVAAQLSLSPKSVDTYRSRVMAKLQVDDLPNLVKFAIRNGITSSR